MIPKCQTLFRPVDSNHYPYLAAWACLFNLFHFSVSLKFRGFWTSTGQPLKRWSYQHPTLEVLLFAVRIAIWLCIHEIYVYTLIWPFITLSLPRAQSLCHIKKSGLLAPFMIRSFTIWYPPGRQVFGKDRGFGICDPAVVAPSSVCNLRFVDPAKVNLWSKTKGWETITAWKERVECWMISYYALTGLKRGRSEGF